MNMNNKKIVVIGGGISGCVCSLKLSKFYNVTIDIYEQREDILKSLPYCHLHVAGALYPELTIKECKSLFYESLEFAKEFKQFLNIRPTIIAYKSSSSYNPTQLIYKLHLIREIYAEIGTYIYGPPTEFFRIYTKEDILHYKTHGKLDEYDNIHTRYIETFCSLLKNINDIKYPFISVMEPGINQELLEKSLTELIYSSKNINIYKNTSVEKIEKKDDDWIINDDKRYDYLVNTMGYKSSDWFPVKETEYLEHKSSWLMDISRECFYDVNSIPEIAVIGERGTTDGMIQLTPIRVDKDITFQVHYMSYESTIIGRNGINKLTNNDISKRCEVAKNNIVKTFNIDGHKIKSHDIALDGVQRTLHYKNKRNSEVIINDKYAEIRLIKATGICHVSNQLYNYLSKN